ncbi:TadE/TadG family type IV pilus assembly protein [Pengzhenrongella sicca]|uniref:Pilus assembly protein n=1 Tax=Pengzhenrongella sicca TaxID=2819238 RepID=A0A8A4ZAY9_9MICO|nr:TadE family protein [Pengzhenrongella sicca]QTE28581.1 pilus assembly protein [Pengzhenrongella sicca]
MSPPRPPSSPEGRRPRRPRPGPRHRRGRVHEREHERGSGSIEMLLVLPALFTIVILAIQGAFYYHAHTLAIAAAQEGARTAGALNSTAAHGAAAAADFIADVGGDDVLTGVEVGAERTDTSARITVDGYSASLIPGWNPPIQAAATVPVERVTPP